MTVIGRFAPDDVCGSRAFLRELKDNAAGFLLRKQSEAVASLPIGSRRRADAFLDMLGRAGHVWAPSNALAGTAAVLSLFDQLVRLSSHLKHVWLATFHDADGLTSLDAPAPDLVVLRLLNRFARRLAQTPLNALVLPDITLLAPGPIDNAPRFVFHAHAICWASARTARASLVAVDRLNENAAPIQSLGCADIYVSRSIPLVPSELWRLGTYAARWPSCVRRRITFGRSWGFVGAKLELTPAQTTALTRVLGRLAFRQCSRGVGAGQSVRARWVAEMERGFKMA